MLEKKKFISYLLDYIISWPFTPMINDRLIENQN